MIEEIEGWVKSLHMLCVQEKHMISKIRDIRRRRDSREEGIDCVKIE
jgi:hypothetical protein